MFCNIKVNSGLYKEAWAKLVWGGCCLSPCQVISLKRRPATLFVIVFGRTLSLVKTKFVWCASQTHNTKDFVCSIWLCSCTHINCCFCSFIFSFLENGSNSASFAIHNYKTIKLLVQFETYLNLSTTNPDYLWDRSNSSCLRILRYAVLIFLLLFFLRSWEAFFHFTLPFFIGSS